LEISSTHLANPGARLLHAWSIQDLSMEPPGLEEFWPFSLVLYI